MLMISTFQSHFSLVLGACF